MIKNSKDKTFTIGYSERQNSKNNGSLPFIFKDLKTCLTVTGFLNIVCLEWLCYVQFDREESK